MTFEVRRIVTGYGDVGGLEISSDTILAARSKSPAGAPIALWSAQDFPIPLDDDGDHPRPSALQWYLVKVPPDKDRGAAANDHEAGLLHEGNSVDLGAIISGEVWLELDGVPEWSHLKAGDTFVQRGTKHAWHNPTDVPAVMSCMILSGLRSDTTPSRITASDHDFTHNVRNV